MKLGRNIRLTILVSAFVLVAFAVSVFLPVKTVNSLVPDVLPANGSASARLIWSHTNIYGSPVPFYPAQTRVWLEKGSHKIKMLGQAKVIYLQLLKLSDKNLGYEPKYVSTLEEAEALLDNRDQKESIA